MHLIFEEDGHFKAGSILSETDATAQVETASGKRSKIKTANILLRFAAPAPGEVMAEAETLTAELDADFLWEAAGTDEFGFEQLAQEYFGHAPRPAESVALLLKLHGAPIYFHKKGKGRYRPAPAETLAAAKAGLEKKRLAAERQARLAAELAAFRLPRGIRFADPAHPDCTGQEHAGIQGAGRRRAACRFVAAAADRTLRRDSFDRSTSIWQASCWSISRAARTSPRSPNRSTRLRCRVPMWRRSAWTTRRPPKSTMRFPSSGWTTGNIRVGIHIAAPALGVDTRLRTRRGRARTALDRVLPGQQDHHVAGYFHSPLHPGRDP